MLAGIISTLSGKAYQMLNASAVCALEIRVNLETVRGALLAPLPKSRDLVDLCNPPAIERPPKLPAETYRKAR